MTFLGRPVLDIRPDFVKLRHGQLDDIDITQLSAMTTPWKATSAVKRKLRLPFLFRTKAEWREFRDFFQTQRQKLDGFWVPVHLTDYPALSFSQGSDQLVIEDINLRAKFSAGNQFAFGALINRTAIECFEIDSIALAGETEELTLTQNIAGDFDVADTVVCALLYARLGDDITYSFITDGVCRAEAQIIELPMEYGTEVPGTRPMFLYEFIRSGVTWRMTNWPEQVVIDDEVWAPDNLIHGEIHSGSDFLAEELSLEVATDIASHPFRFYTQRNAMEVTDASIFETDADAPAIDRDAPIYAGRIGAVEYKGNGQADVGLSSLFRIGEQVVPRMQVQRTCNHRLGDVNCAVDLAPLTTSTTLSDVQETYVEAAAFGAAATSHSDPNWFALGRVTVGNEVRMVVGQDGNKLYIDEPFYAATTGDSASAKPGCDKRINTCDSKYDNLDNTVQFPYLPSSNPQFQALKTPQSAGGKKS